MSDDDLSPEHIVELVEKIAPMLAGEHPLVVGGALADLLAIWLAGHLGGGAKATKAYREEILKLHIEAVRSLIPPNEEILKRRREREPYDH